MTKNDSKIKNGKHLIYEDFIQEMDVNINLCLNKPFYIQEGLIRTYPIEQTVNSLAKVLRLEVCNSEQDCIRYINSTESANILPSGAIAITDGKNDCKCITVAIEDNDKNKEIVDRRLNTCGYFEAYTKHVGDWVVLRYEAKFDIKATEIVYNRPYLYHLCPKLIKDKVLNHGLVPKESKWPGFDNDVRVYLFLDKFSNTQLRKMINHFQLHKVFGGSYLYLRINTCQLPQGMKFYCDPHMYGAVYTKENIPPEVIEIIEETNGFE